MQFVYANKRGSLHDNGPVTVAHRRPPSWKRSGTQLCELCTGGFGVGFGDKTTHPTRRLGAHTKHACMPHMKSTVAITDTTRPEISQFNA